MSTETTRHTPQPMHVLLNSPAVPPPQARTLWWIHVDDHLPDDETTVLVCDLDGDIEIAYHRDDAWFTTADVGIDSVVAWADLPEEPK